jgi:hypothetical protein
MLPSGLGHTQNHQHTPVNGRRIGAACPCTRGSFRSAIYGMSLNELDKLWYMVGRWLVRSWWMDYFVGHDDWIWLNGKILTWICHISPKGANLVSGVPKVSPADSYKMQKSLLDSTVRLAVAWMISHCSVSFQILQPWWLEEFFFPMNSAHHKWTALETIVLVDSSTFNDFCRGVELLRNSGRTRNRYCNVHWGGWHYPHVHFLLDNSSLSLVCGRSRDFHCGSWGNVKCGLFRLAHQKHGTSCIPSYAFNANTNEQQTRTWQQYQFRLLKPPNKRQKMMNHIILLIILM